MKYQLNKLTSKIFFYKPKSFIQFKKKTLEKHHVRAYQTKLLYPVYDENDVIQDVYLLNGSELNQDENLLNKTSYCQECLDSKWNQIYITDRIIDSLTLIDVLEQPAIVIKSVESLNFKVSFQRLYDL